MSKKIVLSGYFGFDNLGDEAILYSMLEGIKKIGGTEITVLSANPEKTNAKFGVKAVNRMSLREVISAIGSCDLFISGGGSLLQDVTSKRSLIYYLTLLNLAKLFGKKVMIYSQGIGPVNDPKNRKKLAKTFKKLDLINVRDRESYQELVSMGIKKPIKITADTVFLLDKPDGRLGEEILSSLTGEDKEADLTIGLSLRPWKDMDDKIIDEIKATIEGLQNMEESKVRIVLLPFHHPGDLDLSKKLYKSLENKQNVFLLEDQLDEREMLSLMTCIDIVISMRLHGLIFGLVGGAYPLAISYDPKIQSLMKELGLDEAMEVESLDSERLVSQTREIIEDLDNLKAKSREMADLMQKRAYENIKLVRGLL